MYALFWDRENLLDFSWPERHIFQNCLPFFELISCWLAWQVRQLSIYCLSVLNPPLIAYSMSMERDPINIFPFPSGMMLCMSVEGTGETPEKEGLSLPSSGPLSAPHSFPLCGLSTAKLQQPTAPCWPTASSCTSLSDFTVNFKVWCLPVDGFPNTPENVSSKFYL